jgi:hypothetical protein
VFPLWLQRMFNLGDQKLTLLNGTTIKYRNLKVPCCAGCNSVHLSQLENEVKRLLFDAPLSEARQNLENIFLWASKILIAIVYAERLLPLRRRYPKGKRILSPEYWNRFQMAHFFVQKLTIPMRFTYSGKERIPGSVFLFNLKCPKDQRQHFDFRDDVRSLSIFIRLGNRGVIAVVDGGAVDMVIGSLVRRDGRRKLHPLQFSELGAKVFYKSTLFQRVPKYVMVGTNKYLEVVQMPLSGLSGLPIFADWDHSTYARFLAAFTNLPIEMIAPGDRSQVMPWMKDDDGKFLEIPL